MIWFDLSLIVMQNKRDDYDDDSPYVAIMQCIVHRYGGAPYVSVCTLAILFKLVIVGSLITDVICLSLNVMLNKRDDDDDDWLRQKKLCDSTHL